jgi:hypothetical protein
LKTFIKIREAIIISIENRIGPFREEISVSKLLLKSEKR